jgi:hypothetical protein
MATPETSGSDRPLETNNKGNFYCEITYFFQIHQSVTWEVRT